MRMANIDCARFIGIDRANGGNARSVGRRLRRSARIMMALAGATLMMGSVHAAEPGASRAGAPKADPAFPFSNEIEAFARANDAGPALGEATLFMGSSSIRLWDIAGSFPDIPTVNRGFGGATTPDVLRHYRRLLPRKPPRSIVVYVGENDLAGGAQPQEVARDILTLMGRLRSDYPRAHILCLSLKPSPIRWTLWPKLAAVNMTVAARSRARGFDYLDVGRTLLAADGLPDASLFGPDGLHMNPRGYQRWTALIDAWLDHAALDDAGRKGAS
ncbi:GDSL-type esterase/lipase family protein [Sphingobium sp. AN558]|uniref:GDSL-type esterase/lipase family protein n=1 Tax=Sphingobium sp. AN558 TaxID=3133442 RepID=UPI0030BA6937